jgi:transcriptional regulator with XRE-family HTH domain
MQKPNEALRYQRLLRGWSQGRVAEAVGTSAEVVSRWETGRKKPGPFYQEKLCDLFGKSTEELGFLLPASHEASVQRTGNEFHSQMVNMGEDVKNSAIPPGFPLSHQQDEMEQAMALLPSQSSRETVSALEGDMMDRLRRQILEQAVKGIGVAILASDSKAPGAEIAERLTNPLMKPLGLAGSGSLLHDKEMLSLYTASMPIYWRLYFDGYIVEMSSVLAEEISSLSTLASQPSSSQKQAASLVSKAYQLACMLSLQDQKFGNAFIYAQKGFLYGQVAEDPNLQAASLVRKALVYFYLKKPEQKLQIYQEAQQYEMYVSPLICARIYMGLSEAHSNLVALGDRVHKQEARHFLDLSYQTIPLSPKEDPNFSYTHFGSPKGYESLFYLDHQQPQKAWDLLVAQSKSMPPTVVPDHVTLLLRQTRALIALGNLEESCIYLEASVATSRTLNSQLRIEETHDVYQQLLAQWPQERRAKDLADVFLT